MKNLKITLSVLLLSLWSAALIAQQPAFPGGRNGQMNIGHFYGKVVDEKGKGVGYATVELYGMKFDSLSKSMKKTLITGQITEDNGDFSLEKLPVMGEFTLKVSFLGYADAERKVSFGVTRPSRRADGQGDMSAMASKFDQDLGNIVLETQSTTLNEVVVKGEAGSLTLALDKKVFRVDKNAVASGGTAEDALRNVPSLGVDLDGNVTLRNSSPQIFVDGRPTTLTLEQIPADAIESVEVITNPSARYDASGGQAGIVNIVLKKERRIGYNGNIRLGADSRGGLNGGADINAREGKFNAFLNANLNSRKGISEGETERSNLFGQVPTDIFQRTDSDNSRLFANLRGGLDWFIDNRNTLTASGSYTRGRFENSDILGIRTDSLYSSGTTFSESVRNSSNERGFRNIGAALLYKHNFPKNGKELTADVNLNSVSSESTGDFNTQFITSGFESLERQENSGASNFLTIQTDYVDPISDRIKLELGARAAIRRNTNNSDNFVFDPDINQWVLIPNFADRYKFDDQVYAAYGSFSHQFPKWGYMLGLRAESSQYTGTLETVDSTFNNDYPLSLFPSVFVTRKLNEEDNIQLSYTRRINRPNFFQLMPFTDFSDSLNLQRGNPDLLPEFTNSLELSYQNFFSKSHNILISAYYKQSTDLITRYQFTEFDPVLNQDIVVNSYANSNKSEAYGVEFTLRNNFKDKIELTTNVNVYNSLVDASNVEAGLVNEQFSWFIKENVSIKLPAQFTFQISGEYQSRTALSTGGGGGRWGGGGGGHWGGPTNTAQGYTIPVWHVDVAIRKDLFKRKATLTLNVSDVFRSRRTGSFAESLYFIQDSWRIRDPQTARLNFSYRFGKMDTSLFKRKNTNMNSEGMDMMQ
ncbi:MAG: TonB-dependent receptor [Saprospiraceae bacterium]|jgi:outer membrane receptor protein involved in Fe transport|nr:TonB-dependent receptor [Saprospiraceae bacterium]